MTVQLITARVLTRWFLAIFQIYCGYRAMDLCGDAIASPSPTAVVVAFLVLLPTAAGIGLILHTKTGRILTLVAQGVQLVGISSPAFTWMIRFGFTGRVQMNVISSDVPGESSFSASGHAELGEQAALAFGHPHVDFEGYVLSFNFLALVIILTVWLFLRPKKEGGEEGGNMDSNC